MKASVALRTVMCALVGGSVFGSYGALAAPNWGVDLLNSTMSIDAHAYADNGQNLFKPGPHYEQLDNTSVFQPNLVASFFGQAADTYDLGATVNLIGSDSGSNPDFETSASTVGVIAIDGIGTRTLDIYWRVTTSNFQRDLGGEGFLTDSMANIVASIVATIDGVAPGTAVDIGYDWEYLGLAPAKHEAALEDPTTVSGLLGFVDEQGTGPNNLFSVLFAEPLLGGADSDNDSYNLTTSNTTDPSFLTIDLEGFSRTIMDNPGDPIASPFQNDAANSTFNGRLTLTLPVPEPGALTGIILALVAICLNRSRRQR